ETHACPERSLAAHLSGPDATPPQPGAAAGVKSRLPEHEQGRTTESRDWGLLSSRWPRLPQHYGDLCPRPWHQRQSASQRPGDIRYVVALGVDDLTTAIEAIRRNVVTQMSRTGFLVLGQSRCAQRIVTATHTTLGTGFTILLNCHEESLHKKIDQVSVLPLRCLSTSKGLPEGASETSVSTPLLSCSRETGHSDSSW